MHFDIFAGSRGMQREYCGLANAVIYYIYKLICFIIMINMFHRSGGSPKASCLQPM